MSAQRQVSVSLQRRQQWMAMALLSGLLAACGGGGDGSPSSQEQSQALTGPLGQITALPPGLLTPGTYALSNCTDENRVTVNRKVRLGADGSIALLNADSNDAVLLTFTPSSTARQKRSVYVEDATWEVEALEFTGTNTTPALAVSLTPTRVTVSQDSPRSGTSCQGLTDISTGVRSTVLPIPLLASEAVIAQRLASAVALNNAGNLVDSRTSGSLTISVTFTTAGGVITASNGNPPYTWFGTGTSYLSNNGTYSEEFDSSILSLSSADTAGTPANPKVSAQLYNDAADMTIGILRNTNAGNSPPVRADLSLAFAETVQ